MLRANAIYKLGRSLIIKPDYAEFTSPRTQARPALRELFRAPLIVGASVSANLMTRGPADRALSQLALDHVRPRRFAANGQTARALVERLDLASVREASVVVGLDVFFWDATLPSVKHSLAALARLINLAERAGTPLVLGTVPRVAWQVFQLARPQLNHAIRSAADRHGLVHVLDLARINREIDADGGFSVGGHWVAAHEIAPDGIHLGAASCEYLGQRLLEFLDQQNVA